MSSTSARPEDMHRLYNLLRGRGFLKARQIPMSSRMIRAVCATWPGKFISTQAGYHLSCDASDAEIENAIADLRSRCKKIGERASALERVMTNRKHAPGLIRP